MLVKPVKIKLFHFFHTLGMNWRGKAVWFCVLYAAAAAGVDAELQILAVYLPFGVE